MYAISLQPICVINMDWGYAFAAAGVGLIIGLIWLATQLKHVKEQRCKKADAGRGYAFVKDIWIYVFLPAIICGDIGWIIPGNIRCGSWVSANDAFIFACFPIIAFLCVIME